MTHVIWKFLLYLLVMDPELIIYLIFLAIVFIARLLKKSGDKTSGPANPQDDSERPPTRRAKSFEELLEEFTTGERRESPESQAQVPVEEEVQETHQDYSSGDSPYQSYRDTDARDFKTLDELVDIEKVRTKTALKSEEDTIAPPEATEVRRLLQNPDDARMAIILSEIIRRRY